MNWTVYNEFIPSQETCNKVAKKTTEDSATNMHEQLNSNPNRRGSYSTEVVEFGDIHHFSMWHTDGGNDSTPMFIMWHVCLPEGERPDITKIRVGN